MVGRYSCPVCDRWLFSGSFSLLQEKNDRGVRHPLSAHSHCPIANSKRSPRAIVWTFSWPIAWLHILGLFLMGLYAGQREFFQKLPTYLFFVRKAMWWALALGLAGILARAGIFKLPDLRGPYFTSFAEGVLETVGYLALSLFYASVIILLVQRQAWKTRLAPLAAVGRMALSNYLFQSLICTTIFYGYGLGLFGKVGPAAGLGLTFAIYAMQIPLSLWWLRRFRFGPMEWVLEVADLRKTATGAFVTRNRATSPAARCLPATDCDPGCEPIYLFRGRIRLDLPEIFAIPAIRPNSTSCR
jgi:Protein of unknown function (DUF418)